MDYSFTFFILLLLGTSCQARAVQEAQCPAGFTEFCDNSSCDCYNYVAIGMPWETAEDNCRTEYGAQLTSIHSDPVNQFLTTLIPSGSEPDGIWIGAKRDTKLNFTFSWSDGSCLDYGNFQPGTPDNLNGDQDCIRIVGPSDPLFTGPHQWDDYGCGALYASYCKIGGGSSGTTTGTTNSATGITTSGTGVTTTLPGGTTVLPRCEDGWRPFCHSQGCHCYNFINAKLTWDIAEDNCINVHGGHLASVHSDEENKFLFDWVVETGETNVFIGLNNLVSAWAWSDGTDFDYVKWGPSKPSCPGTCHAGAFYYLYEGWTDQVGSNPKSFFCKKNP